MIAEKRVRYAWPKADAARMKVRIAQELIESAQRILGSACQELSSLVGGSKECGRLSKLYDQVHAAWYRVGNLADVVHLDHEPRVDCKCGCATVAKMQQGGQDRAAGQS